MLDFNHLDIIHLYVYMVINIYISYYLCFIPFKAVSKPVYL